MANANVPVLAQFARHDGAWIRCADCPDAFWGDFRPTAFVVAKLQAHRAKAHGGQAVRPQRRAAAARAQGADAGLLAAVDAFVAAHVGGARRLGRGVSREVYPFGPDYVIKIAHDPTEGHNLAEAKVWESAPDWARKHLCPVLAHDPKGVWLLMRRAERVGEATWGQAKAFGRDKLQDRIGDMHEQNVGWLDGHMVAIDYAGGWAARSVQW